MQVADLELHRKRAATLHGIVAERTLSQTVKLSNVKLVLR
jgi:hypothetical protein